MGKIYIILLFLFISLDTSGQNQNISPLKKQLQVGLSFQGPDITYQTPIFSNFLLSLGVGGGLMNVLTDSYEEEFGVSGKKDRVFSPFTRLSFRRVYNRSRRLEKGRSIVNNAGNYIAFQNKLSFGGSVYGTVMINEFHWGTQLPLGNKFIFEAHTGLGMFNNIDMKVTKLFPTVGFKFSYVIL